MFKDWSRNAILRKMRLSKIGYKYSLKYKTEVFYEKEFQTRRFRLRELRYEDGARYRQNRRRRRGERQFYGAENDDRG